MPVAVRRALAHRGLLSLVALLVVVVATTGGVAVGGLVATTTASARAALGGADPASLVVTTRLADDPAAQDAALDDAVDALFGDAPVLVERAQTPSDGDTPFVTWTLTADPAVLAPDDLAGLAAGSTALRTALRQDDAVAVRGITVTGDLGERAAVEDAALGAARAVVTVPLALLVLLGLVALTQVGRVLVAARASEVEILVARGASQRRIVAGAAAEASVVGVTAAALGTVLATVLVSVLVPVLATGTVAGRGPWTLGPPVVTGAVTAAAAIGVLTVVAARQARSGAVRGAQDRSGRLRQAATVGTVVAVAAVAVLGVARLRSLGSPAVAGARGVTADPLAAVGPAVALVALGLVVLALLGPATRVWAAVAARGPGLTDVLVARRVARGLRVAVVPVVLLVLAAGSGVLAGAYAGTEEAARQAEAAQAVGTDVRAAVPVSVPGGAVLGPDAPPPDAAAFAALPGASAAAPALAGTATVQGEEVGATALPADAVPAVVATAGAAELAAPLRAVDPFDGAPALPDGTSRLELDLVGSAVPVVPGTVPGVPDGTAAPEAAVSVWLAAPDGTLTEVDAGAVPLGPRPERARLTVPVDDLPHGSRVAAVGLDLDGTDLPVRVEVQVRGLAATTGAGDRPVELGSAWTPVGDGAEVEDAGATTSAPRLAAVLGTSAPAWARLVAGTPAADADLAVVPTLLTAAAADRWAAADGDTIEMTWAGAPVTARVVGVVAAVPGQARPAAVLVDLASLDAAWLRTVERLPRPGEVWVAAVGDDVAPGLVDAVADEARDQASDPDAVTVTTVADALRADAGSPVRLVFLVVAAGAALVALVGLAAVAVSTTAGGRAEVVVLRALGVAPRTQGAGRALELGVVAVAGIVAGLLAGAVVARLAVPALVSGVVPGAAVALDTLAWPVLVVLALVGTGTAVVAGTAAAVVAAQARDTGYRAEVR